MQKDNERMQKAETQQDMVAGGSYYCCLVQQQA
jgi:hypothetical protein